MKPREIAGGLSCPKCKRLMQRCEHKPEWTPRPGRFYFRFWDVCRKCRHIQHYEFAKVLNGWKPPVTQQQPPTANQPNVIRATPQE